MISARASPAATSSKALARSRTRENDSALSAFGRFRRMRANSSTRVSSTDMRVLLQGLQLTVTQIASCGDVPNRARRFKPRKSISRVCTTSPSVAPVWSRAKSCKLGRPIKPVNVGALREARLHIESHGPPCSIDSRRSIKGQIISRVCSISPSVTPVWSLAKIEQARETDKTLELRRVSFSTIGLSTVLSARTCRYRACASPEMPHSVPATRRSPGSRATTNRAPCARGRRRRRGAR